MPEHTPGPWEALLHHDHVSISYEMSPGVRWGFAEIPYGGDPMAARETARLITAAPDLLEACEAMLRDFGEGYDRNLTDWRVPALEKAIAAIAKAKGEAVHAD